MRENKLKQVRGEYSHIQEVCGLASKVAPYGFRSPDSFQMSAETLVCGGDVLWVVRWVSIL